MSDKRRRDFIKLASLTGLGIFGGNNVFSSPVDTPYISQRSRRKFSNMCGYAASPISEVKVAVIGLGNRGSKAVKRLRHIQGVEIVALCDLKEDKVIQAAAGLNNLKTQPELYFGDKNSWKEICEREDVNLLYIATPWDWHTPMAVYGMKNEKHIAVEVPAAKTIDECWELVETSEQTRMHCMMLENCCYDFFEMLTLNMAQHDYFGEIIHCEGAYLHNLLQHNFDLDYYEDMWRLKENAKRNGNLYPTHGLGPVSQVMNINRGDTMDYLVSMSSSDFNMHERANELARENSYFENYSTVKFRGNINTTTIRTKMGKTIMLQHDVSSPRPYSRIHLVSGTKAIARKYPDQRIGKGEKWLSKKDFNDLEELYTPELTQKVGALARDIGGHGGMDFIMDWRLIDCLRNGLHLDQDVYDAALWSAIAPLSEHSVKHKSQTTDIPDFTRGSWKKNLPVDISLRGGGTTSVLSP